MPQIYERGVTHVFPSGSATCLELFAPPRGVLRKLVIKQTDGTLAGYVANVYNRSGACADLAEVSSSFDDQDLLDPELHRICDEITVTTSNALSSQHELNCPYQNLDEQDVRRTPKSRIYLEINPSGSGDKTFQVTYAVEPIELS